MMSDNTTLSAADSAMLWSGIFHRGCSFVKKPENGNPLSRAKAHISRDVLVIAVVAAKIAIMVKKLIMTVVPTLDLVALKKITIIA
jgi:hypothetical protein